MERIDLSTAPSAMEQSASRWQTGPKPRPVAVQPALPFAPLRRAVPVAPPPIAPTLEQEQARRAKLDAMKAVARDIPDPRRYARQIPLEDAQALVNAERINLVWYYRADTPRALLHKLRCVGLCYLEDRGLTHFARAVRRVLAEEGL